MKPDDSEKFEQVNSKLRDAERQLVTTKKEVQTFQNMLEQSQVQYQALEKKYSKAKQLVREFQQRELDMLHREDFYQQLLQEKDTEYNALVKNLKDRIIALEQDLLGKYSTIVFVRRGNGIIVIFQTLKEKLGYQ